jgi:RimJ/RimL family protein N-acetyltransferase
MTAAAWEPERMGEREELTELWPLFGLSVRTPRLELRYPTDAELAALTRQSKGIHQSDFLPFAGGWSLLPDGERERAILQHHWGRRGSWTPQTWALPLVVLVDGEVVGSQTMLGTDFAVTRMFETGSWLGRQHQGRGLGTEMRAAVLHLGFAGLGGERAETDAVHDNAASLRVTEKHGYRPNGDRVDASNGRRTRLLAFTLERGDWEPQRRDDITVGGLEPCLELFGLGPQSGDAIT